MPRDYYRKRHYNRRYYRRRRLYNYANYRNRIYAWKGFGKDPGQTVTQNREYISWRTAYEGTYLASAGPLAYKFGSILLNSCYDPFLSGGANFQPLGYDQLTPALYERYRVWSGYYNIVFNTVPNATAATALDANIIVWLSRSNSNPTTARIALAQPGARVYKLDAELSTATSANRPVYVRGRWDVKDWFQESETPWTAYNADPASPQTLYLNFFIYSLSGGTWAENTKITNIAAVIIQKTEMARRTSGYLNPS